MPQQTATDPSSALKAHAETRLKAANFADCEHQFRLFICDKCGATALVPTIERHGADEPGDFHGLLWLECPGCGWREAPFGMVQQGDHIASVEEPKCDCGSRKFYVASCERWEDWGFFDEGTVSVMCAQCGSLRTLLDTD